MQNGMPGALQAGLNIIPRQFRVATQQGIPGFILGQLFQNGRHGNPCALDDRLAATHARIDFNALAHVQTMLALRRDRKRPIFPLRHYHKRCPTRAWKAVQLRRMMRRYRSSNATGKAEISAQEPTVVARVHGQFVLQRRVLA